MVYTRWVVRHELIRNDSNIALPELDAESIDVIITDPPYGLTDLTTNKIVDTLQHWVADDRGFMPGGRGFMNNEWDRFVPPPALWDQCFRVLKPGGMMLVFAGSRTQDLMGLAIRLAGFDIHESLAYMYGTGFPKNGDLGKAIRKLRDTNDHDWDGWATQLKPGYEPILVARKPFKGAMVDHLRTVGVGAFNIDATRVPVRSGRPNVVGNTGTDNDSFGSRRDGETLLGRFTPNVILQHSSDCVFTGKTVVRSGDRRAGPEQQFGDRPSGFANIDADSGSKTPNSGVCGDEQLDIWDCVPDCPIRAVNEQSGITTATNVAPIPERHQSSNVYNKLGDRPSAPEQFRGDTGGASRYFNTLPAETVWYGSKASRKERVFDVNGKSHPTVKPLALIEWLIRLVCPPGAVVLDPFAGSGTIFEAGYRTRIPGKVIGIEANPDYWEMIETRISRS